ncbi:lytic transglycosylase domain-containing protein [Mucilaginibacter aquatilis]|uniref:Transglycosylase SLT domain-containing protein n=1 Tax=Mucilaginibacter aquatilis TaxID=1517760 RepID=A0A6I4IB16_9SPHI|nr:lytic transglycosylase domain-containing protein [Mucilaginibacter aquatilis]MVN92381.1 transglycosylase SLT domain-containing protein [Mucilaginibacter aquatilis]
MKKLFTIIFCVATFQSLTSLAQPAYTDTSLYEENFRPNYMQSYRPAAVNTPVITQLKQISYQNSPYRTRLDAIQGDVQLDYNEFVQAYISNYTSAGRRDEMGRIIGLSKYYFPIYEKAFKDAGIPDEIKYLSIVESALNPNAVSRVGATGPWQFMYSTAKIYGLDMNNYVDERRDPIQASYAAAAYLRDAYQEFGDWLLAIASYNCGKNSVERAMQQADAVDFWSIRQYLPAETRGYVPAFIATMYVMKYHNEHGIVPQACNITMNTDTVMVNKFISLSNIAKALSIDVNQLSLLNPSYTKRVINGTTKAPRRIVIPQIGKEQYPQLYAALNGEVVAPIQKIYTPQPEEDIAITAKGGTSHIVKRGETYSTIAGKYGIDEEDLRIWNNVKGKKPLPGQKLKVSAPNLAAGATKTGKELAAIGSAQGAGGN